MDSHISCIHSSMDGHLAAPLGSGDHASVNMGKRMSVQNWSPRREIKKGRMQMVGPLGGDPGVGVVRRKLPADMGPQG